MKVAAQSLPHRCVFLYISTHKTIQKDTQVSPLAQLMSLGFLPGDSSPHSPPHHSERSPSTSSRDIMELDHIRARCIRVKGVNAQSHIIDVSDLNDAKVSPYSFNLYMHSNSKPILLPCIIYLCYSLVDTGKDFPEIQHHG